MTRRLNIVLDELVLHGSDMPDPKELERQLSDALASRLSEGRKDRTVGGNAASQVAERIVAALPPGERGGGRR